MALDGPEFLDAATPMRARRSLDLHVVDGRLRRASLGGGSATAPAILEDHAALATGLLTLYQLDRRARRGWTPRSGCSTSRSTISPTPTVDGRWFDTADDAEQLMVRPADPLDGATPSGASLDRRGAAAGRAPGPGAARRRYARRRGRHVGGGDADAGPAAALGRALAGRRRGRRARPDPDRGGLRSRGLGVAGRRPRLAPGGAVVVGGAGELLGAADRPDRVGGADAAYVCRGRVCDLPVTTAEDLAAALGARVACRTCRARGHHQDRQPLSRARRAGAAPTTSPSSTPTTPPSRTRSAARCTSAARRSAASTQRL